jgi:hypothetical protein
MTSLALFGGAPGGDVDTDFAQSLAQKDAKTAVNQFCQRYCHRPVTKEDITYTLQKYPGGYQATCKLNCIEGQEFAGELAPTQKDAEKSASQQVLAFYAETIANMPKAGAASKKKKRPATGVAGPPAQVPRLGDPAAAGSMPNPSLSAKSELNSTCAKILRRVMEKNEVTYETHQVVGGYQSTVRMPGLPDEWGAQIWAGEVSGTQKDAEQNAAQIALDALRADPALMAAHNAPQKPKNWSPHGGKGRGHGVVKGGKGLQVAPGVANQWNAAGGFGMVPW